jgi:hypothetical protein
LNGHFLLRIRVNAVAKHNRARSRRRAFRNRGDAVWAIKAGEEFAQARSSRLRFVLLLGLQKNHNLVD